MEIKVPDFFVVGAPKCGTTSLHYYLGQHKDIYLPGIKEPHYLLRSKLSSDEIVTGEDVADLNDYLSLYKRIDNRISGDCSVFYLYFRVAEEIYALNKNAKIIIMLRNPVNASYSLHSELVLWGIEKRQEFMAAYKEGEPGIESRKIRNKKFSNKIMDYRSVYSYFEQVKSFMEVFSKNNIKIILFDDFVKKTESVCLEVFSFVGASVAERQIDFSIKNRNEIVRSRVLRELMISDRAVHLRKIVRAVISDQLQGVIKNAWRRLMFKEMERRSLDARDSSFLKEQFRADLRNLEALIDLDLSGWYT
jgi:hypothetical protein